MVHLALYLIKSEFLMTICLSRVIMLSNNARNTFRVGVSDEKIAM